MKESRIEHAKRNITGGLVYQVVLMAFRFVTRTAIVYAFGSLYLGLNSLYASILHVLSLAELGFGSAVTFSMYEPMARGDQDTICALLKLYRKIYRIIGAAVSIMGLAVTPLLPYMIQGEVPADISIYALYLINLANVSCSYFLFGYREALLVADQRSDISSLIGTGVTVLRSLLQIYFLLWVKSYYLYCVLIPVFTVARNLAVYAVTNRLYPQYVCRGALDRTVKKDIMKRVTGLLVYKISDVFRNSVDSIIISSALGLTVLAKYNNYFYLINASTYFLGSVTTAITAGVGNSIVSESVQKNYRDFEKFHFIYLWIIGWATVCFFCLYQPFMRLWMGEAFLFDDDIMAIFCVYFYTWRMGDLCFTYRQAAGLWWQDKVRPIAETAVNLVLNILLVRTFGVAGILYATIFCLVFIDAGWGGHILYRYYFSNQSFAKYLKSLGLFGVLTCLACLICYGILTWLVPEGPAVQWISRISLCVLLPPLLFWLALHRRKEYREAAEFTVKALLPGKK